MRRSRRFIAILVLVAMLVGQLAVPVTAAPAEKSFATGTDIGLFEGGTPALIAEMLKMLMGKKGQLIEKEPAPVEDTPVEAPTHEEVVKEVGESADLKEEDFDQEAGQMMLTLVAEEFYSDPPEDEEGTPPEEDQEECYHIIQQPVFIWDQEVVTWEDFCNADETDAWTLGEGGVVLKDGQPFADPLMNIPVNAYSLAYDAETGIGFAPTVKEYRYTAQVTGECAVCGEEVAPFPVTVKPRVLAAETQEETMALMEEYIGQEIYAAATAQGEGGQPSFVVKTAIGAYLAEGGSMENQDALQAYIQAFMTDPAKMEAAVGAFAASLEGQMLIKELKNAYGSVIYTAEYTIPIGSNPEDETEIYYHTFKANMDASKALCLDTRDDMYAFNAAFPQYFGTPAPYWTSKGKSEYGFGEMGIIGTMFNMPEAESYPYAYLQPAILGISQGFISYVMRFGPAMDAMMADAMSLLHEDMTDIQRALVLHDWMAKYGSFDMQSLVDMADPTVEDAGDPITMTPFAVLLHDNLGLNGFYDKGGVCLGYAAAYVLLLQAGFLEMNPTINANEGYDYFINNPIADFVGIRFLVDVEDSSVAAGDSGFEGTMFNSPHYFNTIRALDRNGDPQWYVVDASYNDVHTETLTQQRVETDGSISHGTFMLSPMTTESMFEGRFQYMDFLHDGSVWVREYAVPGNPQAGFLYTVGDITDEDGNRLKFSYEDAVAAAKDRYKDMDTEEEQLSQIFFHYEQIKLDPELEGYTDLANYDDQVYEMPKEQIENLAQVDIASQDISYEDAWFAYAVSEITYDPATHSFYYVSNPTAAYATLMRQMEGMEDMEGMMEMMGDMFSMEDQLNDPANADKMRRRPVGAPDLPPEEDDSGTGGFDLGGMMGGMFGGMAEETPDPHATTIFHYAYGTFGDEAQASEDKDNEDDGGMFGGLGDMFGGGGFDFGNFGDFGGFGDLFGGGEEEEGEDENVIADEDKGPWYDDCAESKEFRNMYPDLAHTLFINDGKVYFNVGRKILTMTNPGDNARMSIKQFKEYNDISYGQNDNRYIGMSFHTDAGDDFSLRYHPVGAITLKNQISWKKDEDDNPFRELVPTIFVSIATNFSNSYRDENGDSYKIEAVNYNPAYNKFMDDGSDPDVNTNVEFMWCANVVDKMVLETALNDTRMISVTVDPWCGFNGFTERRSEIYGLSDGSTKREQAGTALYHVYKWNEKEQAFICNRSLHVSTDFLPGDVNGDGEVNNSDLTIMRRYISNKNTVIDKSAADLNSDGTVNNADMTILRRYLGGASVVMCGKQY